MMNPRNVLSVAIVVAAGGLWAWAPWRSADGAPGSQSGASTGPVDATHAHADVNHALDDLFARSHQASAQGPLAASGIAAAASGAKGGVKFMDAMAAMDQAEQPESPEVKAQNAELRALGYHIAEKYYHMTLADLRKLAAQNDTQALMHLAERYLFALDGNPQDPDFEPGKDYKAAGRQALQQALAAGNRHAASVISETYLTDHNMIDAAAWNLVARRLGDKLSADWFIRTPDYLKLTPAQKDEAARVADRLWATLDPKLKPS